MKFWGATITFDEVLIRRIELTPGKSENLVEWKERPLEKPKTGIVVGFRTVFNGISESPNEDNPMGFTPVNGVVHALVAEWYNKKPVRVPLSALKLAEKAINPNLWEEDWKRDFKKSVKRDEKGRFIK